MASLKISRSTAAWPPRPARGQRSRERALTKTFHFPDEHQRPAYVAKEARSDPPFRFRREREKVLGADTDNG